MALRVGKILWNLKHYGVITLLTILTMVLTPILFIIVCLPVYLWRYIVQLLKIFLRPDLARMVSPRSAAMAQDKCTEPNPKCNLVIRLVFEGKTTLDDIITQFRAGLPIHEDQDRSTFKFPEFHQFYEKWLGFIFWKWETEYGLNDHFTYFNPNNPNEPVTSEQLVQIELDLVQEPFPRNYSPWKIVIIPNYVSSSNNNEDVTSQQSMVCFKIHHGLADGFSILNLIMREIGQQPDKDYARPNYFAKSTAQKILDYSLLIFKLPFQFIQQLIESYDQNEWRIAESDMSPIWWSAQTLTPIDLNYVKGIKNSHGVCFTTVVVGAITGGIRRYLHRRHRPIPEQMSCLIPFPMPGFDHTTKLRNFFSYAFLKFPIAIENPYDRLKFINKNIRSIKKSTALLMNFWEIPIIARLLPWMMKPLLYNRFSTCLLSNFPGPNEQCSFMENKVIDVGFNGGLLIGNTGLGMMMLSYNGKFTLRVNGCKSLFPTKSDLDELLDLVLDELENLRKSGLQQV